MISFDKALGNHVTALLLQAKRSKLLSANLANSETPQFKARDIDFKSILAQTEGKGMTLATTAARHLPLSAGTLEDGEPLYRVPDQPSLDGNSVNVEVEQSAFVENAIRYQVSLRFLGGRFKSMISALKGE